MCAIAIPEVRFGNVTERTPVDTSRIPLQRLKLVSSKAPYIPFHLKMCWCFEMYTKSHLWLGTFTYVSG